MAKHSNNAHVLKEKGVGYIFEHEYNNEELVAQEKMHRLFRPGGAVDWNTCCVCVHKSNMCAPLIFMLF